MKLHITLEPETAGRLARALGGELAGNPESADVAVVFFKNPAGGVSDPAEIARHAPVPARTIVVAGVYSLEGEAFAESACRLGIPQENILFASPEGLRVSDLIPYVQKLAGDTGTAGAPLITFASPGIVKVPKLIGVVSAKGGVGKTTFAASLVAHYASVSEKAALFDLGAPRCGRFHITSPEHGDVLEKSLAELEEYKDAYRRIVVDAYPFFDGIAFERVVTVVDADVVQCVEPTCEYLTRLGAKPSVVVYNRRKPEVPEGIISSYFSNAPVVVVEDDFPGCMAALAAGVPASMKSEKIARAVGQIAALIDKEV